MVDQWLSAARERLLPAAVISGTEMARRLGRLQPHAVKGSQRVKGGSQRLFLTHFINQHILHLFRARFAMPALSLASIAVRRAAVASSAPASRLFATASAAARLAPSTHRAYAVRASAALAVLHGVQRTATVAAGPSASRRSYADVLPSSVRRPRGSLGPPLTISRSFSTLEADEISLPPFQADLGKTPLHDYHIQKGAKMVPFAGYMMPLSYSVPPTSGLSPHAHVRTHVGLFDVGHMVQSFFRGPGAQAFLESLCPTDLGALGQGEGGLTVLLNKAGGIVDDTIITKHDDETFYVVTNAGRRIEDLALFREHLANWGTTHGADQAVEFEILDGWGLVALQGSSCPHVGRS